MTMSYVEEWNEMNKINTIIMIKGEVKVGKTYLGASVKNSILIDLTADSNSKAAAINVYGEDFDKRYFRMNNVGEMEKLIEETDATTIVIDEGRNLRDLYANVHLNYLNELRVEGKQKLLKTIYPVTEWRAVYDMVEGLFRKYDGEKNFVITEGMKDRYVWDKESKQQVMTGERIADGINILPTLADVIIHVGINESIEGSPPKVRRARVIRVVRNRFLDIAGENWVERIDSIEDLMNKICENNKVFKKEMFV